MKFPFTVSEYLTWLVAPFRDKDGPEYFMACQAEWYQKNMPFYDIAVCPFCGTTTKVRLDLATITGWDMNREHHASILQQFAPRIDPYPLQTPWYETCMHSFAFDGFMNFHGTMPVADRPFTRRGRGSDYYGGEVPGVMPDYFDGVLPDVDPFELARKKTPICQLMQKFGILKCPSNILPYRTISKP